MKAINKNLILFLTILLATVIYPKQVDAQQSNVSFQVFYDQLSPYGQWINNATFGDIWYPNVESGFVPYSTGGHWVLTDYG